MATTTELEDYTKVCTICWARHRPVNAQGICEMCERHAAEEARKLGLNRLVILQARAYGADEAYLTTEIYAANQENTLVDEQKAEVAESHGYDDPDEVPEEGYGSLYVDSEETFCDGDIVTGKDGRKFRIRIEEVTP